MIAAALTPLAGCGGGNSPIDQANQAIQAEAGKQFGEALGAAMKTQIEEINKQAVTIDVLGIPGDQSKDVLEKVQRQIKPLLPADNHWVGYNPRWIEPERLHWDPHVVEITAAPVTDVKDFARKLAFGAVLAVDEPGRRILLDYGKDTTAMDAWGGPKELQARLNESEREAQAERLADHGSSLVDHLAKQHERGAIAYVIIEGKRAGDPSSEFDARLKAATERLGQPLATTGWHWNEDKAETAMVTGPDLEAFARAIDFASVKWLDPKRRVIVLTYVKPGVDPAPTATGPVPERGPADSLPK
jgi:hypothetical protein